MNPQFLGLHPGRQPGPPPAGEPGSAPRSSQKGLRASLLLAALSVLGLAACTTPRPPALDDAGCQQISAEGALYNPGNPREMGAPEIPTGFASKKSVSARSFMVVAANPLATKAGCDVLKAGGSAVDAAIATQMVLNIVEPQSSGIGGGAFMLHYNAAQKSVVAYDGRETAPAAATENYLRWVSDANQTTPLPNARSSGRSIGTPGVMRMLEMAHQDAGVLPWKDLFTPAITIATNGFKVSPRMASSITSVEASLQRDPEARAYFLDANDKAWPAGTLLKSPALATTFNTLATQGAAAFYNGALAQDIVDEIADTTGGITPGLTTLADLSAYQAKKREAVCITYRSKVVCGMPPPSSGGLAVAQALGMLETYNLAAFPPSALDDNGGKPTVTGVHLVSEALRLAYADRDKYVADSDFVPLPGGSHAAMLDKTYLRQRASLISLSRSMGTAQPGTFPGAASGVHPPARDNGTTHLSVVDRQGNVVSMTTTIEGGFGSFHMTRGGFLLNNQLTDFSAAPADAQGVPIANRLQPGKRPRSSMAPTLVFEAQANGSKGDFVMATGSPGGSTIIQYTTKTLVGVLDWGLNAQQATSMINFGAANSPTTNVGGEHPNVDLANGSANDPLVSGLRRLGHTVSTAALSSGVSTIVRRKDSTGALVLDGGADPRREGVVLGDVVR